MSYDDHFYCERCDKHALDCWCRVTDDDEQLIDPLTERDCPGGEGHGFFKKEPGQQ